MSSENDVGFDSLFTMVHMLKRQSDSINQLMESQINLTASYTQLVAKTNQILTLCECYNVVQEDLMNNQKLLLQKLEWIESQLENHLFVANEVMFDPNPKEELTNSDIWDILDVFAQDIRDIKLRLSKIESRLR